MANEPVPGSTPRPEYEPLKHIEEGYVGKPSPDTGKAPVSPPPPPKK